MQRGDFLSAAYVEAAAGWARAILDNQEVPPPRETEIMEELEACFGLGPVDKRILDLALGVDRSPLASRLVRERSGRGRLTVALVRTLLGDEAEAALAPRAPLRRHGLIILSSLPEGLAEPGAKLALAPGVAARLSGWAPSPLDLGPGVSVVAAKEKPTLPESLSAVLRDHLVDVQPGWVTITGSRPSDTNLLAEALSHRLSRASVVVDGRAAASVDAWAFLSALRRECDLTGSPLFVDFAAAVGGAWRALAAPAAGKRAKPIVLLNPETPLPRSPERFTSHAVSFVVSTTAAAPPPPLSETPIEVARRKAAVDAAVAMGKPIPGRDVPIQQAVRRPNPPPEPVRASRTTTMSLEDLAAQVFMSSQPASTPARSPSPAPEPSPSPAPEPSPTPSLSPETETETEPPPPAAPATTGLPTTGDPSESLPYEVLPAEPTQADALRIAATAPNPLQRAEIMAELAAAGAATRDVNILKLLRSHTSHAHPAIRQAAEEGLKRMFGAKYSAGARPIAPPVQPPRSDD